MLMEIDNEFGVLRFGDDEERWLLDEPAVVPLARAESILLKAKRMTDALEDTDAGESEDLERQVEGMERMRRITDQLASIVAAEGIAAIEDYLDEC